MKKYSVMLFLCMLGVSSQINAQRKMAGNITVCNIVQQGDAGNVSKDAPLVLYIQDSATNEKLNIVFKQSVIKKMSFDPRQKLVNQRACISGVVKTFNQQPAIFIYSEKQIKTSDKPEVNKMTSNG